MRNGIGMKGIIVGLIVFFMCMSSMPIRCGTQFLPKEIVSDDWLDQENSDWNGAGTGYDGEAAVAQSFIPEYNTLTRVELIVWNTGNPHGNLTVSIREDLNDTDITSITMPVEEIPQQFQPDEVIWTEFDFPDVNVTAESTYYIVWSLSIEKNPGPIPYNVTCWGATQSDNYTRGEQWYGFDNYWHSANPGWDFCFKTYAYEAFNAVVLFFGVIVADAKISFVEKNNESLFRYFYMSEDVKKVTVIGIGSFIADNNPELHPRLYMKTFTNVSLLAGDMHRKLIVSEEYQHFSSLSTFYHPTILILKT
jgi:hypothetical protein